MLISFLFFIFSTFSHDFLSFVILSLLFQLVFIFWSRSNLFARQFRMSISGQRTFLSFLTEDTTITISDFPLVLGVAAVYYIYRRILTKFLLEPLSTFITHSDAKKQSQHRFKFVHRSFDLIHYLTAFFVGSLAAHCVPYGRCPFYFGGCEVYSFQTKPCFVCSRIEKAYYCLFVGYYISDVPFITTVNDVWIQSFHHVICFCLESLSVLSSRPVILFSCNLLHDTVDVFLYLGKVLTYLKFKKLADVVLLTFAGFYLWFRLINFGIVIYTFWFLDVGKQEGYAGAYLACKFLVFALLLCHIIWFYQIARAFAKTVLFGRKEIRDSRSDELAKKKAE
jgi:hypothetical protein